MQILRSVRRIAITLLSVAAVLALVLLIARLSSRPPGEAKIIANFNDHRPTYEQLRDMLVADENLRVVAEWGVETRNSGPVKPPQGNLSITRYNQYLLLLKDIDAKGASRSLEHNPRVCVWVWASGFGGDTRHREVCWLEKKPENQVATLDEFYRMPKPRKPTYRHIDGNWYIWADW